MPCLQIPTLPYLEIKVVHVEHVLHAMGRISQHIGAVRIHRRSVQKVVLLHQFLQLGLPKEQAKMQVL